MQGMTTQVGWVILLLGLASAVLTGSLLRLYRRSDWVDIPNARSSHVAPVPTGGGLSVVLVFALYTQSLLSAGLLSTEQLLVLNAPVLMAIMGFIDDRKPLPVRLRLSLQLVCAAFVLALTGGVPAIPLPGVVLSLGWVGDLVVVVTFVWFINLFNFMDGTDGLAITQTACFSIALLGLGWYHDSADWLLLSAAALLGASLGFAVFNLPPARIFMGDVGSHYLGALLAALALLAISEGLGTVWTWMIIFAVFIVDSTFTLLRRMTRKEPWLSAHRSHAYQRMARRLGGHAPVLHRFMVFTLLWLFPLAWLSVTLQTFGLPLMLLAYLPLAWLCMREGAGLRDDDTSTTLSVRGTNDS